LEPEFTTCLKGTLIAASPQGPRWKPLSRRAGGGRTGASNRRLRQAAQVFSLRVFLAWSRLILTAGLDFAAEPGAGAKTRLTLVRGEGVPTGTGYAQTMKQPSAPIRYLHK
jgi:hypothetical protein